MNLKIRLNKLSLPILTVKSVTFLPMMKIILKKEPNLSLSRKKKKSKRKIVKKKPENQVNQEEEILMTLNKTDKT